MQQPDKLIVRAVIPSADNPDVHILHVTGCPPLEAAPINASQEDVLRAMGRRIMGHHLSVDRQLSRQNVAYPFSGSVANVSDLQTKPIDRALVTLGDQYMWSDE